MKKAKKLMLAIVIMLITIIGVIFSKYKISLAAPDGTWQSSQCSVNLGGYINSGGNSWMTSYWNTYCLQHGTALRDNMSHYIKYKVEISNLDEIGNIYKLENMLKSFDIKINTVKEQIAYNEKQLIDIKEELDKPFTQQDRIRELQKEKARIDSELDLDKQENTRSVEDTNEEEMER